jgi:glycosyltransferase involved in cell wall biosynthesis
MRVVYLTDNPNLGGTVRTLQSWLLLGQRQGTVNGVVVVPPGSKFGRWLADHQIPFTSNPSPTPDKRWPIPSLWHAARLARWMKRHRIQLIHCNEHNIYPFAALLRRLTGLPLVCHVRYSFHRQYAQWAFAGAAREPDALLWTSRQQQADCADAIDGIVAPEKQHLVPLGVDLDVFGARTTSREPTRTTWGFAAGDVLIGQACALRPRKRIHDFIDLVAMLRKTHPHVRGVLAGDAAPGDELYRAEVVAHLDRSGLGTQFRWLGDVDDVEAFDHAIDIFVSTSEYETFGNSVCEAMACGRPVVGYTGGSVHEVVGDAGAIVANRDLQALVEATRSLVARPELRRTLGEQARQRVAERFSPAATLETLTRLYRSLIRN